MKEGQNDIYYITGGSIITVSSSSFLEALRTKSLVVLHRVDPVDEYCVQQLKCSDLEDEDEKKKLEEFKAEFEPLTKRMKEVLGNKVKNKTKEQKNKGKCIGSGKVNVLTSIDQMA